MDLVVENGVVVEMGEDLSCGVDADGLSTPAEVIDFSNLLLLPSLREHHAHLDKALTADKVPNRSGDLRGAIDAWIAAEASGFFDVEEMEIRAERAVMKLLHSGVTHVRTHVNVGDKDKVLRNLRAVDAVKRRLADLVELEIVALVDSPLTGALGSDNRSCLEAAVEFGIDLVGGCPHLDPDPRGVIDVVFEIAEQARIGVDLHVDETLDPDVSTLQILATRVLERGFDRPVTASHCVSMSEQPVDAQIALASLLKEAKVRVVALPQTNLFLQGRDRLRSMPRGIAPIGLLAEQGVEIAAGGDNVEDPFNPMGRSDPLETASLLVMAAHLSAIEALGAVTTRSCRGATSDVIGQPADFVAVPSSNAREAIAQAPPERITIRNGNIVARTTVDRTVIVPGFDRSTR